MFQQYCSVRPVLVLFIDNEMLETQTPGQFRFEEEVSQRILIALPICRRR